jgi:hypothetical protein
MAMSSVVSMVSFPTASKIARRSASPMVAVGAFVAVSHVLLAGDLATAGESDPVVGLQPRPGRVARAARPRVVRRRRARSLGAPGLPLGASSKHARRVRHRRAFCIQLTAGAGHALRWAGLDPAKNVAASRAALAGDNIGLRACSTDSSTDPTFESSRCGRAHRWAYPLCAAAGELSSFPGHRSWLGADSASRCVVAQEGRAARGLLRSARTLSRASDRPHRSDRRRPRPSSAPRCLRQTEVSNRRLEATARR